MKKCGDCGRRKPDHLFAKKLSGLSSRCKACIRRYSREHYDKNKHGKYKQYRRAVLKRMSDSAKNKPCADCGESYPPHVMDLDHRIGETKKKCVANLVRDGVPVEVLVAEIAKCDTVCSNCHRERTYQRATNPAGRPAPQAAL